MAHQPLTRDIQTHYGLDRTAASAVEVLASDLEGPGLIFCPNPKMPLWSGHPRIFIDVASSGDGKCPYCGTVYRLKEGEKVRAGH